MKFIKTKIPSVIIIEPDVLTDHRGFFLESYNKEKYHQGGITADFVQDNHSKSGKDTIRGLHGQYPNSQAKLVRVIKGKVIDIVVDVRLGSPTFKQWLAVELSEDNFRQLFVPKGFLHGFCVLSDEAEFEYKCDDFYSSENELAVRWNDPAIGIDWPIDNPVLSEKDKVAPLLDEIIDKLPKYTND